MPRERRSKYANDAKDTVGIASQVESLSSSLAQKATKEEVQQISLSYKESYGDLTALQAAYPTGDIYNHTILSDGMIYTYKGGTWISTGIQANGTGIADKSVTQKKLSFPALSGVLSKNLFDKNVVTIGYYIDYQNGNAQPVAGSSASDWIEVEPSTNYVKKTNSQLAFYDTNKNFISGLATTNSFTTPVNCFYVRMTVYTYNGDIDIEQLEKGNISTPYEKFGAKLDPSTIPSKAITPDMVSFHVDSESVQVNVLTVKTDGTGDFLNLSAAISSITNSSAFNKYTIEIYEGTYNVFDTLTGAELSGAGILLPDYVDLKGIGDRDKIILKGELLDSTTLDQSTRLSTLNIEKNNNLSNLTITAKNCRYAVHADNSNTFKNYVQHFENCYFKHNGNAAGLWSACLAWGEGTASGAKETFENCIFEGVGAFSSHNNPNFDEGTYHEFDNCEFISQDASVQVISMGSGKKSKMVFKGCKLSNYMLLSINGGTEFEFDITGYGNGKIKVEKSQEAIPSDSVRFTREYVLEDWVTPTLLNGWTAQYGMTPRYRKDGFGIVHFEGFIIGGAANTVIFNLPVGYRPTGVRAYVIGSQVSQAGLVVIEVGTDGSVNIKNTVDDSYMALDVISFFTD
jgi:hypothetical protein